LYENCVNYGSDHSNIYGNGGALIWAVMESGCALVKMFGTAPKQNLNKTYFF